MIQIETMYQEYHFIQSGRDVSKTTNYSVFLYKLSGSYYMGHCIFVSTDWNDFEIGLLKAFFGTFSVQLSFELQHDDQNRG